ncbi:hypothetical protein AMECASPLE_035221 [Ameca splendens]|uniref:Uncharacterized protein n=1 Tax=Ameca splendens TaxID=208324 RepID=A0ABV0XKL9_9TELE
MKRKTTNTMWTLETCPSHGYSTRDASSSWPERERVCLPAANDSVSFHQNETQKKSGPKPTEMDNDPCCLPEPEERYTGFILKAHLMRAEEKQAGAKFLLPPGEVKVDKE